MCPGGVLGTYSGVLVDSRGLPGRSLGRPWGCWGILGDTLGSLVALGVSLGDSLGVPGVSLGSPCRGPSAPYVTHTDVSAFSVFLFFRSYLRSFLGFRSFFRFPWGVLGAAGGSLETPWGPWLLLGSHWATPWGFLGCPWGVLVGDLVPHMLRTPMFQRFLCFCFSDRIYVRFWVSDRFFGFLGASLGLLGDPLRHLGGPWLLLGSPWATPWGFLGGPWGVLVGT